MGEPAVRQEALKLSDIVEKISVSGKLTKDDQNLINEAARMPMQNMDIMAVRHLTELIRSGVVKVV